VRQAVSSDKADYIQSESPVTYSYFEDALGIPSSPPKTVVFRRRASPSGPTEYHSLARFGPRTVALRGQVRRSGHADKRQRFGGNKLRQPTNSTCERPNVTLSRWRGFHGVGDNFKYELRRANFHRGSKRTGRLSDENGCIFLIISMLITITGLEN